MCEAVPASIDETTRSKMFGHLKQWGRIHTRYEQSAYVFMSAIALTADILFWINR